MCGIAGILAMGGRPPGRGELQAMCDVMIHRGPDEDGYFVDNHAGLGMRRLSIIDLNTGRQPIANEDGTIHVVLNGEIYNFRDLRHSLECKGHRFRTSSDTECIAHLYEEHGVDCVQYLRGMFGLALWDARKRQLLLARDRLGIKPLYYAEAGGRLLFASELKSLLQLPEIKREINWAAAGHLFASLYTPAADAIVAGVHKLEPGCVLVTRPGRPPSRRRYWDVNFDPDYSHSAAWFRHRLRELIEESVALHLESDVPVGAFLSGGVDSSSVVAVMNRLANESPRTFSIGFREGAFNEAQQAARFAESLGTRHLEQILGSDFEGEIESIAWHLDEPFGDSSAIPTWLVSRLAGAQVKVVLSGDGGDELFAGYDKYRVEARERRFDAMPGFTRNLLGAVAGLVPEGKRGHRFLRHFTLTGWERYLDASTLFKPGQKANLFHPAFLERMAGASVSAEELRLPGHWLSAAQYLDLKTYLPLDILTKVDRMSMAHSLEVRVPLLDHKLVEFACTIPPEMNLCNGNGKSLFKAAMADLLPSEILQRPKHGFAVPLADWFRGQLAGFIRDLLLSDTSRARGIFNAHYVERLLAMHHSGRDLGLQLWTLASFELWCRLFLDRLPTQVKPAAVRSTHGTIYPGPGIPATQGAACSG